jgi:hypothetical protein
MAADPRKHFHAFLVPAGRRGSPPRHDVARRRDPDAGDRRRLGGQRGGPTRLVSPFNPGGAIDVPNRVIAYKLSQRLGQQVYVDAIPAANTIKGADTVAKAAPDGYTFMITTMSTHVNHTVLFKTLPFNPVKDFAPITQVSLGSVLLTAPGAARYGDVRHVRQPQAVLLGEDIDDTHFRIHVAGRVGRLGDIGRMRSKMNGKFWWELSQEEHRRFPGDYEAQVSQGPIAAHSAEHLCSSDHGVALLRRFLRQQPRRLPDGADPASVARGPEADAMQRFADCGNFIAG